MESEGGDREHVQFGKGEKEWTVMEGRGVEEEWKRMRRQGTRKTK